MTLTKCTASDWLSEQLRDVSIIRSWLNSYDVGTTVHLFPYGRVSNVIVALACTYIAQRASVWKKKGESMALFLYKS